MSTKPFIRARDIAAHLTTLLAGISKADGYETNIGLRVFRGKRKIDDSHIPCAVIIEGEDKPGGTQGGASQQVTQSYVLGGYAECDPDHPNDAAHQIIDASVCEGMIVRAEIGRLFDNHLVAYIHLHNAMRGCFSCRVNRA